MESNPGPLRYWCNAQSTDHELLNQMGAGHFASSAVAIGVRAGGPEGGGGGCCGNCVIFPANMAKRS